MKLRIGLIGIGHAWENRHRPALRALSDRFEVRAVCEPVAHRAQIVARDFGAVAVDGFSAVAQREDVDAILILSGQWFGALPILAACDAGKAVYCAAPLDFPPDVAQSIQQRLQHSGVAFVAELPQRHAAATLRLKELIATRLGSPRLVFCHQRIPAETPGNRPPNKPPVLPMHEMVQLVDWCRYVVGRPPTSVLGLSNSGPDAQGIDYEMMSLDFAPPGGLPGSGVTCQISSGRYMPVMWHEAVSYRPPAALQVACENGIAFIDMPSTLVWFDKAGRHMESLDSERPVGEQLLNQFHRAVTSLVRNTSGLEDAFQAMWIVQRARESHHSGQRMTLDASSSVHDPLPAAGGSESQHSAAAPEETVGRPVELRRKKA
ncbi:MAG TPA: Gfo/Idh/MocA family oxidoreductase [Pirellulales bacterium]|nr:Gfo/Idh/MocA family oxidoreductase [Pirellulales bacterium]